MRHVIRLQQHSRKENIGRKERFVAKRNGNSPAQRPERTNCKAAESAIRIHHAPIGGVCAAPKGANFRPVLPICNRAGGSPAPDRIRYRTQGIPPSLRIRPFAGSGSRMGRHTRPESVFRIAPHRRIRSAAKKSLRRRSAIPIHAKSKIFRLFLQFFLTLRKNTP